MLFVVLGSLIILRPMLIPAASDGSVEALFYEIVAMYAAPAAAFLIGFVLIAAPLEQTLVPSVRFGRTVLLAAMACAILAVLLHNLIDFAIFEPGVWMTFWIAMACLVAGSSQPHADAPAAGPSSPAATSQRSSPARCLWRSLLPVRMAARLDRDNQDARCHACCIPRSPGAGARDLDAAFAADPDSSAAANLQRPALPAGVRAGQTEAAGAD